jgi:hypothetical protein
MNRFVVSCCWIFLVSAGANSAPSPFSAKTVNGFLDACKTDRFGCSNVVRDFVLQHDDAYNAQLCIRNSSDAAAAVVQWLATHPKTHTMARADGIVMALKALNPC